MKNNTAALLLAGGCAALWGLRQVRRQQRRMDFCGRIVLITGGSRGLGLIMARQLVREGARVVLCARDGDELDRARDDLAEHGGTSFSMVCDVRQQDQVEAMVRTIQEHVGPIDVLINNAGVIEVGPLDSMTFADFREAMETHFWGPLYTTLAVLPEMRRRRQGRIVNISSIGGKISVPHLLPYCASKFALTGLSEGLRLELARDQVWVTTVCPNLMRTGSPPNAIFKGQHRAEYAWFSISGSFPVVSMNADRAARQILDACRHGDPELVLTLAAKLAVRLNALFPGIGTDVLSTVNRLLPGPGGIGTHRAKGKESYSQASPSLLTALGDKAALKNNESPQFPAEVKT